MTDPDTPAPIVTEPSIATEPKPSRPGVFTQANITTGLAVLAVLLAGAPYVVPQLQAYQVQAGLMAKPAMLEDASRKLGEQRAETSAKEAAASILAKHDSIFNDKADPVVGTGPIKVVEFLDYQCAYCRAAAPVIKDFLAQNPDVSLVIKEYPVIHPPTSRTLAAYGMAAAQAGKYAGIHDALLTEQVGTQAEMDALLSKAGVDPTAAKAAATSKAVSDHIDKTIALGGDLGINGTPTFIVGNTLVTGAQGLEAAVQAERARLKKAG